MTGEHRPETAGWDDYTPQDERAVYDIELKPQDECGVVAVSSVAGANLGAVVHNGLLKVQHRGPSSAGLTVFADGELVTRKDVGLVDQALSEKTIRRLPGGVHHAMGHTRYKTSSTPGKGGKQIDRRAAHPITLHDEDIWISVEKNGHLNNYKDQMSDAGVDPDGAVTDTDGLAQTLMAYRQKGLSSEEALARVLPKLNGAFSLIMMDEQDRLLVARDANGFRPLMLGSRNGDGWAVASETAVLPRLGARAFTREINQGELLTIQGSRLRSEQLIAPKLGSMCLMELIYLTSPASRIFGHEMSEVRQEMGRRLAAVAPVEADAVIGVPDSGVPAAIGYARAANVARPQGFEKNPYVGRTFILEEQMQRADKVRLKLNPIQSDVAGKRLVVVDDSLVRGTTTTALVEMLREAGASEVHLRISSPPYLWPCFYGLDTGSRDELIGAQYLDHPNMVEEIRRQIGADSLAYLELDETIKAIKSVVRPSELGGLVCTGCFDRNYPTEIPESWLQLTPRNGGV